uniref:Polyferredoxin-like protein n=1 Tax=Chlorobium chlorochromatii (strain CaD3) TaxID=340177 RepID=Q3AQV6_CHLCH
MMQAKNKKTHIGVWKRRRRIAEIAQAILLTAIPFITINGHSILRFDIPTLKLYFLGTVFWIRELYLLVGMVLIFLLFIGFITAIFGRIWCGWLCPQTVLLDLSQTIARFIGKKQEQLVQRILLIPFAALIAFTLICYFVPPAETLQSLFSAPIITAFFVALWIALYLELAFLGRGFCTSICPYAMLQNMLFDKETLVIEYDISRDSTCMKCDDCVTVCPVGIDIKKGLNSACIACAECIDACKTINDKRHVPPFPNYKGTILRAKSLWLGGVTALAAIGLAALIWSRPPFDVVVTRNAQPLPPGINRYSLTMYNNSSKPIEVELSSPDNVMLLGNHTFQLAPFGSINSSVMVKASSKNMPDQIELRFNGNDSSAIREVGFF